jgi:hypothetical protein
LQFSGPRVQSGRALVFFAGDSINTKQDREGLMKFLTPRPNSTHTITSVPDWPSIEFETDTEGPHTWQWTLTWGIFRLNGTASTPGKKWNAKAVTTNYGGTLSVRAQANKELAVISVQIKGTNPTAAEANRYLATKPDGAGFDKILAHETKYKHFNARNEPVKSFDNGYGMCQLTTPRPTFAQVWNWKLNIDGGLKLFAQKRTAAIAYLSQSKRTYTTDQLKREAVCRWNGGAYHEWDTKAGKWVRQSNILCDTATGNIGWDMNDADNKGKTEADLHKRDAAAYRKAPAKGSHWKYSGVCYADRVLGK